MAFVSSLLNNNIRNIAKDDYESNSSSVIAKPSGAKVSVSTTSNKKTTTNVKSVESSTTTEEYKAAKINYNSVLYNLNQINDLLSDSYIINDNVFCKDDINRIIGIINNR